jgi:hypothetical protein
MANNNNMKKIQFNTMGPEQDLFRKRRSDTSTNYSAQTSQAAAINNNSSPGITRVCSLKEMLLRGLVCDGDYMVSNYIGRCLERLWKTMKSAMSNGVKTMSNHESPPFNTNGVFGDAGQRLLASRALKDAKNYVSHYDILSRLFSERSPPLNDLKREK